MKAIPLRELVVRGAAAAVALFLWIVFPALTCAGQPLKLTILHMNDTHGHYLPRKSGDGPDAVGGFARAATVIRDVAAASRKDGREVLLLHAGDILTGTPFSMVWKGELGVNLLNALGFQAMTVGNHEFDYGKENLVRTIQRGLHGTLLSANIHDQQGNRLFRAHLQPDSKMTDVRVIVFGLTTDGTPVSTHPGNVRGLEFEDPLSAAMRLLRDHRQEDVIIALTHLGVQEDVALASGCPKIDVIVGGHSHTALHQPLKHGSTVIVQAGAYTQYVGRLDLDFVDGRIVSYHGDLTPLDAEVAEDPQVARMIADYQARMGAKFDQVIGRSDVFLDGRLLSVRSSEPTNLGRLVAYTMARSVHAEAAILNGGSIRESIHAGDITLRDIYTALPFPNYVVSVELTGETVRKILQRSQDLGIGEGGKLQTFGIRKSLERGKVIVEQIGARNFAEEETYRIATNDFLVAGGDGYDMFGKEARAVHKSVQLISNLVIAFVKERQTITSQLISDFTVAPDGQGTDHVSRDGESGENASPNDR